MYSVQAGQTIGPYRIIQQIGQGGMASVYKAYQPAMERYVALKILPYQLAESPEFAGRFQQEARTIARLEHAHILPVHDYGESGGYTYLAMRFIEGGTLGDRLRAGPLSPEEIDRWFSQLADALDYAHAQGVVHRDLKPSNVLLDARGNLFLTDFGIAKLLEADKRFTGSGTMIGTPAYMSPEQGQGSHIDQRTDIYSLGIMLYEMVTGRVPFEAETPLAIILKHINDPLPLPSSINPNVTPAVEQVLLKALAKNPNDRFATVGQFSAAWTAARRPNVTQRAAAPPSLSDRSSAVSSSVPGAATAMRPATRPPWAGRFTLLAGGALLLIGLLVCASVAAVVIYSQSQHPGQPRPTGAATVPVVVNAGTASSVAPTGSAVAGGGSSPGTWRSWTAANDVRAVAMFSGQLVSGGPGGLTRWNVADGTVAGRLTTGNGLPSPNVNVLLADDSAHRLWIGTDGGLVAYDGQTTRLYDENSGLDNNTVAALALTKRGLLVGTLYSSSDGAGLNLLVNDRWQPVAGFPSAAQTDAAPNRLSTSVTAVLEDSHGIWWVGTTNGLGRYDGQTWTRYSTSDGLPNNEIDSLMEAAGVIWVGTSNGPAELQGNTFVPVVEAQSRNTYGMFQAANGDLWLICGDAILHRPASGGNWQTIEQAQFPAREVFRGLEAPGGTFYFSSDTGVLRFDGRAFDLWSIPNVPTNAGYSHILAGLAAGQLWFLPAYGSSSDLLNLANTTWMPGPSGSCDGCYPLAWGPDGRLWAGSQQGMWVFQLSQTVTNVTHLTATQGLPDGPATAVAFASDGSTWIGTSAGVAVYAGSPITTVFTAANAGLADDSVNHLLAASDGSMWVATDTDLSRRQPDGQWIHYGPGNPFQNDVRVNSLAQDASGAVWVATDGEGVYRFAGDAWTQFRPGVGGVRLPSTYVLCVTPARDGSVWFGTTRAGAARFDGANWQAFTVADGLIDSTVNDIYIDSTGVVWFATNGGASAYRP